MDKKKYDELRDYSSEKIAEEISKLLGLKNGSMPNAIYAAAYTLLHASEDNTINMDTLETYCNTALESEDRRNFLVAQLNEVWANVCNLRYRFSPDDLKAVILFYEPSGLKDGGHCTPAGITSLAKALMQIKTGDKVADLGVGRGSFLRDCFADEPDATYYGNDINEEAKEIAAIRAEILGGSIVIEKGDILDMPENERRFDVAFSNYPFGMRMRDLPGTISQDRLLADPAFSRTSMDWLFNAAVYRSIEGPRRAVCIMSSGSTWNTTDKSAREWFLKNGMIEAVISLPTHIFEYTGIGVTMIVMSRGNSDVMMVDARNLCEKGRRLNVLDEKSVEEIIRCCGNETELSKRVSYDDIKANDYVLNPERYLREDLVIEDGVPFETVIKRITRGLSIQAKNLDALTSEEPTDIQHLTLENIKDGVIDESLPYLRSLDKKHEKYCVENNDLILSKSSTQLAPFKVAVAEVPGNKKILASGSLYVITLDEEKVDPYYIKAFLESDIGAESIRNIAVGTVIPIIGVEQLKKLTVPCPPMEKQRIISEKYCSAANEIKELQEKLKQAQSKLKTVFDSSDSHN